MSRKIRRVRVELNAGGVRNLPAEEIKMILRGADDLIFSGGRTLLTKILKGSHDKKLLERNLDKSPAFGFYHELSPEEITARIDWVLLQDYLDIEYDGRLPLLVYTEKGWEIEQETYAMELLRGFDEKLKAGEQQFDMAYLKGKNRGLILLLLDKVEASGKKEYIPLLEAWGRVDYKKVKFRIHQVICRLDSQGGVKPQFATANVQPNQETTP